MITTTLTDLVRNFHKYLDSVESKREEIVIIRNNQEVARLVPGPAHQTALEAMAESATLRSRKHWNVSARKAEM